MTDPDVAFRPVTEDPCEDAHPMTPTGAYLHVRPVRCQGCRRYLRYAFWEPSELAHRCGRCRFGPGDEPAR